MKKIGEERGECMDRDAHGGVEKPLIGNTKLCYGPRILLAIEDPQHSWNNSNHKKNDKGTRLLEFFHRVYKARELFWANQTSQIVLDKF